MLYLAEHGSNGAHANRAEERQWPRAGWSAEASTASF